MKIAGHAFNRCVKVGALNTIMVVQDWQIHMAVYNHSDELFYIKSHGQQGTWYC